MFQPASRLPIIFPLSSRIPELSTSPVVSKRHQPFRSPALIQRMSTAQIIAELPRLHGEFTSNVALRLSTGCSDRVYKRRRPASMELPFWVSPTSKICSKLLHEIRENFCVGWKVKKTCRRPSPAKPRNISDLNRPHPLSTRCSPAHNGRGRLYLRRPRCAQKILRDAAAGGKPETSCSRHNIS